MYFELIIKKNKDNKFIAKCPLFPKCKGIAENEDLAIKKLCNSISYYISKSTNSFFQSRFLSNDFSEVITNPTDKKTLQHRVIDLVPRSESNQLNIFLSKISQDLML